MTFHDPLPSKIQPYEGRVEALAASLQKNVLEICEVSPFFAIKKEPCELQGSDLRVYLDYSAKRLDILTHQFKEIGYERKSQFFTCNESLAVNALFTRQPMNEIPDQAIYFVAHHDYLAGKGAEDNATALSVMVEIARHFRDHDVASRLVFGSFDLEERALLGSQRYLNSLSGHDCNRIAAVIDLEMLGSGRDLFIVKSVGVPTIGPDPLTELSDYQLVRKLESAAQELGIPIESRNFPFMATDQVPFARRRVSSAGLVSFNGDELSSNDHETNRERTGISISHSNRDVPENLDYDNLEKATRLAIRFVENFAPNPRSK